MSRDTSMRGEASSARRYSYRDNGRTQRGLMGDHVFKKGSVEVYKPSWKGTTTTIRVYPALAPENPTQFDPWRFSADDADYGEWIRTYPAVRNFGDPGVTFILFDPSDAAYDPQLNPAWMVYNAVYRAVQAGQAPDPKWAAMLMGGQGRGAALRRPQDISMVQCGILQHNGKEYDPPKGGAVNDGTIVMELSPSAAGAMLSAMDERNPDFRGDPDQYDQMFVHGDPINLNGGQFVNFFQLGFDPRERARVNPTTRGSSFGQARDVRPGGGAEKDDIGFGCFLTPDFKGMPASLAGCEDLVRRKWKPWDDVVQILTTQQQIQLLSGALPASMIEYAFRETYADMIPESVWKALRGRVSAPTGGEVASRSTAPVAGVRQGFGGSSASAPAQTAPGSQNEVPADPNDPGGAAGPDGVEGQGGGDGYGAYPQTPVAPLPPPAPPTAGSRQGFGGRTASSTDVTVSVATPTRELPDTHGFDTPPAARPAAASRPAAAAPPATSPAAGPGAPSPTAGAAVQAALAASRQRLRRSAGNPPPA